LPALIGG
jgi:prefoldin subunit 4